MPPLRQSPRFLAFASAIAISAVAGLAPPAHAQRGGQRPSAPPTKPVDTSLVRKTPDGFVLDFQNQPLSVVLSAIAEAGGLNISLTNIPSTPVTLRMGQAVTKAQAIEILRGVVAANDLKITETAALIRVEGTAPSRAAAASDQAAQALAQRQQVQREQAVQLRLYTYRLKHANAAQLAPILMNLLTGAGGIGNNTGRGNAGNANPGLTIFNPGGGGAQQVIPNGGRGGAGGGGGAAAAPGRGGAAANQALQNALGQAFGQAFGVNLSGQAQDIRIVAEDATNSLLVRATAEDWALVQTLLGSVDLRPLQVLIEVTIAQVQRTHDLNVGLSGLETRKGAGSVVDTTAILPSAASARDFVYLLTGGKGTINYNVALNALQTRGDVKVLSLPILIAQNNKEAVLDVGQNVPFVQVSQTSGIDPTGRVQTIQYQSVGKTLTITPTINPDGYVNLAVKQTDNTATNNIQFNAPIINKQEATTQVFIRDGQTTVIGGLSDNSQNHSTSGLPFLSRIPLIGFLFGNKSRNDSVSELYLFLTPHIVSSDEDIDRLREAVKGQSDMLKDMNVEAKIVPKGDTLHIGTPVRPRPDSTGKPDSTRRRPEQR